MKINQYAGIFLDKYKTRDEEGTLYNKLKYLKDRILILLHN